MKAFEITWENGAGSLMTATVHAHTSVEAIWEHALQLGWRKARAGLNPHPGAVYVSCQEVGTFAAREVADGVPPAERRQPA